MWIFQFASKCQVSHPRRFFITHYMSNCSDLVATKELVRSEHADIVKKNIIFLASANTIIQSADLQRLVALLQRNIVCVPGIQSSTTSGLTTLVDIAIVSLSGDGCRPCQGVSRWDAARCASWILAEVVDAADVLLQNVNIHRMFGQHCTHER